MTGRSIFATGALLLAASQAWAAVATSPLKTSSLKVDVLTDGSGLTLYTFDPDTKSGEPTCYDACARAWPPALAADGTQLPAPLTLVARKDGTKQIAYKGRPLYRYARDAKPGDALGDTLGGIWYVARP